MTSTDASAAPVPTAARMPSTIQTQRAVSCIDVLKGAAIATSATMAAMPTPAHSAMGIHEGAPARAGGGAPAHGCEPYIGGCEEAGCDGAAGYLAGGCTLAPGYDGGGVAAAGAYGVRAG